MGFEVRRFANIKKKKRRKSRRCCQSFVSDVYVFCVSENVNTLSILIYDLELRYDGHKFPDSHSLLFTIVWFG